ncbi:MAG TPA: DUF3299 domain-containing protein [Pirellulales bacterium]|nr:DUF3299 domain-containing protein [Pirellulales bacterium]
MALLFVATGCEDGGAPTTAGSAIAGSTITADAGTSSAAWPQREAATDPAAAKEASSAGVAASSGETPDTPAPSVEATPQVPETRQSASPGAERTRDITFDDLKFNIEKGDPFKSSLLTEKIESLEGKPIRIRGYILPSFQQSGLTQFVLVRDNLSCCFGPGAALYDCLIVEMKAGKSTDYSLYPVAVDGIFSIREMLDPDGKTVAIYHVDGESVR